MTPHLAMRNSYHPHLAAVAADRVERADNLLSPGPTMAQYRWCAIAINYTDLEVEKVAATIGIDPSTALFVASLDWSDS